MLLVTTSLVLLIFRLQGASTLYCSKKVAFVIVSQPEPYHASVAARLRQSIEEQLLQLDNHHPNVHLTHEDYSVPGAWTIAPLLSPLVAQYGGGDVRWVVFLEAHTAVRCERLLRVLEAVDGKKDVHWIGYPLRDEEPTIVHHFKFYEELDDDGGFTYPHLASGFAMRMELVESLQKQIASGQRSQEADFSIDPAFELAQLVYGDAGNPGPLLTPELSFCVVSADNCAAYPRDFDVCGAPVPETSVYFAVKTHRGFHASRAKALKKTWGRYVTNLQFFSDKADPSLPAIDLGIPNTETGHCAKTVAILKYVTEKIQSMPHIKWIFLADDDTILGVSRLCEVLSCYRGGGDVTILGERYGYGYGNQETAAKGYDYITGGGGTALSVRAATILSSCACASADAPDDMALGACAKARGLSVTHSPLFHQAGPADYPREALARGKPLSFHRHAAPPGPQRLYATWFLRDDSLRKHDEL